MHHVTTQTNKDLVSKTVIKATLIPALLIAGVCFPVNSHARNELQDDDPFEIHVEELKQKLPDGDFKLKIEKPFVVISDESVDRLNQRSKRTIRWAVERLKKDYFDKDPEAIIDIWLFKDKESYETNAEKLFGRKPHTPYGYYSSHHRALVMNISTGGGTLVHEIVHPFIESNFPDCPSWFNEGLASLYEQCGDKDGKIWGYTNWRLKGLQIAIRNGTVPSFKELCSTTRREFYEEDRGTNYAQARYLCYYLQEQGKLREFYEAFTKNVDQDPTGFETLKSILECDDMDAFLSDWQDFVLGLTYP